jgi:hypothetical protein
LLRYIISFLSHVQFRFLFRIVSSAHPSTSPMPTARVSMSLSRHGY